MLREYDLVAMETDSGLLLPQQEDSQTACCRSLRPPPPPSPPSHQAYTLTRSPAPQTAIEQDTHTGSL